MRIVVVQISEWTYLLIAAFANGKGALARRVPMMMNILLREMHAALIGTRNNLLLATGQMIDCFLVRVDLRTTFVDALETNILQRLLDKSVHLLDFELPFIAAALLGTLSVVLLGHPAVNARCTEERITLGALLRVQYYMQTDGAREEVDIFRLITNSILSVQMRIVNSFRLRLWRSLAMILLTLFKEAPICECGFFASHLAADRRVRLNILRLVLDAHVLDRARNTKTTLQRHVRSLARRLLLPQVIYTVMLGLILSMLVRLRASFKVLH